MVGLRQDLVSSNVFEVVENNSVEDDGIIIEEDADGLKTLLFGFPSQQFPF